MTKKPEQEITDNILIADAMVRIKTLENILVAKGIFTPQEYAEAMKEVTGKVARAILEKAKVSGDLDQIVKDLQDTITKQN